MQGAVGNMRKMMQAGEDRQNGVLQMLCRLRARIALHVVLFLLLLIIIIIIRNIYAYTQTGISPSACFLF